MSEKQYIPNMLWYIIGGIIAVGLLSSCFYFVALGATLGIFLLLTCIVAMAKGSAPDKTNETSGCLTIAIAVVFTIVYFMFFSGTRYIIEGSNSLHLYPNCRAWPSYKKTREVVKLEGFLYGCFSDCDVCKEQEAKEKNKKEKDRLLKKEQEKQSDRKKFINELQETIDKLENGADCEEVAGSIEGYMYKNGFIKTDEDNEEGGDWYPGVPSRYQ